MKCPKILHLDLDAFFCSVEELIDPSLIGTAFAVGGAYNGRGVITSASYAARLFGVRSAMPTGKALALCPHLKLVHGKHKRYSEYSDEVMAVLEDMSPLVQQVSVDEAFIDVSDLPQPIISIAQMIQSRVDHKTNLSCSIGAATSKLVAKVANDFGKSKVKTGKAPHAITVVECGKEAEFLAPLDVQAIWGIGPKSAARLRALGLKTVGHLAELSKEELKAFFGSNADFFYNSARGIDTSPVRSSSIFKSVSNETTFGKDKTDEKEILSSLRSLSDKVGYRLRQKNLAGTVIQLKLRYSNFDTISRQVMVNQPTNLDNEIFETGKKLFLENWNTTCPVRLIGIGVHNLTKPFTQLSLLDNLQPKKQELAKAVDHLKDRYGRDIIKRASSLQNPSDRQDED